LKFCTGCGSQLVDGTRFCRHCAQPVVAGPAATTSAAVATVPPPASRAAAPVASAAAAAASGSAAQPETPAPRTPVVIRQVPEQAASADPASVTAVFAAPGWPPADHIPPAAGSSYGQLAPTAGLVPEQDLPDRWAPSGRRRSRVWIAAGAVLLIAAVVGGLVFLRSSSPTQTKNSASTGPGASGRQGSSAAPGQSLSPSPTASPAARKASAAAPPPTANPAAAAAKTVSDMLDASTSARGTVVHSTSALANCSSDPTAAVASLSGVVALRQSLLARGQAAPFEALPSGPRLRALLTQAWTASLHADQSFLDWARDEQNAGGCDTASPGSDSNFAAGNASSADATAAKKAFSSLWNAAVSGQLHVAQRSETDF